MKFIRKMIGLHKFLFFTAMLFTFLSVFSNLYWNSFLADLIDHLGKISSYGFKDTELSHILINASSIILLCTANEFLSSYLASYTCELFAHEMRMGYARFYLQCDIQTLSKLNVGAEQSAMQNELTEISAYLNENLFSLTKQFVSFVVTVTFLLYQNPKLAFISILPVIPVMVYCSLSSKIVKHFTEQCQKNKEQINGLAGILLELFPVIQIYNAYGLIHTTMNERLSEWQHASIKKERTAAKLMSLSGLLSFIPLLLLVGFGGFMVINHEISIGVFYIFINLSGNVSGFLQNMPGIYAGFRRFQASLGRIEKKIALDKPQTL